MVVVGAKGFGWCWLLMRLRIIRKCIYVYNIWSGSSDELIANNPKSLFHCCSLFYIYHRWFSVKNLSSTLVALAGLWIFEVWFIYCASSFTQ